MLQTLRDKARLLKRETLTLYFAARDAHTPWYAKLYLGIVVAYALSPVDLIPDFIPVLGFLDEVILLPFALALGLKMLPVEVIDRARTRAQEVHGRPRNFVAAAVIVLLWISIVGLFGWWASGWWASRG